MVKDKDDLNVNHRLFVHLHLIMIVFVKFLYQADEDGDHENKEEFIHTKFSGIRALRF